MKEGEGKAGEREARVEGRGNGRQKDEGQWKKGRKEGRKKGKPKGEHITREILTQFQANVPTQKWAIHLFSFSAICKQSEHLSPRPPLSVLQSSLKTLKTPLVSVNNQCRQFSSS